MIKTPLRYPGGKSKAIKYLESYFPNNIKEIREPFCGGASVSIYLKQKYPNIQIMLNDKYFNLYCFWKEVQQNPERICKILYREIKQCNEDEQKLKELFDATKKIINICNDSVYRAAYFFILNRCSYGGLTELGSFSKTAAMQRFTNSSVDRIMKVSKLIDRGIVIGNLDYSQILNISSTNDDEEIFVFMDPPYDILKNKSDHLYKHHQEFDHWKFWTDFIKCKFKCMITYNYSEDLVKRYADFNQVVLDFQYGFHHAKDDNGELTGNSKKELIIMNY